jgi:hypothetical protein
MFPFSLAFFAADATEAAAADACTALAGVGVVVSVVDVPVLALLVIFFCSR